MACVPYQSPAGVISVMAHEGRLAGLRLGVALPPEGDAAECASFVAWLDDYFAGRPRRISMRRLDLDGMTAFRHIVYAELVRVPFGRLVRYGELAARVGRPGSARAVGAAMAANPMPIVVPCHRVVPADGRLGGFGAGPRWKTDLLRHEGHTVRSGRIA